MSLCDRFVNLNPIKVRKYPAHEVFLLMKRLRIFNEKSEKNKVTNKKGVIRRKAGDDWF